MQRTSRNIFRLSRKKLLQPCTTTPHSSLLHPRSLSTTPTNRTSAPAKEVTIVEVGPRDGLQNEKTTIPPSTKLELIRRLAKTGLTTIEAGSFVSPKWVPQMDSSAEIFEKLLREPPAARDGRRVRYQWLLPNEKGLENFLAIRSKVEGSGGGDGHGSGASSGQKYGTEETGPSLNTSSMDPNAMPEYASAVDALTFSTPPSASNSSHPHREASPALNTSSQDPNAMPSHTTGSSAISSTSPSTSEQTTSSSEPTTPTPTPTSPPPHEISIFLAATETFSHKNTNRSISDSLKHYAPLISRARALSIPVRAYISVALGCPYEGADVSPHAVASLAASLLELGADEISVADTTGMGTAPRTAELLKTLSAAGIRNEDVAMHFHDTYGQALVNTVVALEHGVRRFDSAVAGLGGCPFSPGATGNVGTEDLVWCLEGLGVRTGVDVDEVARTGAWISKELGKANESRAGKAILAKLKV